jgi:hypothetical protein
MKAKLIHKAEKTWLPTAETAYYFGMPDNKVYVAWVKPSVKPTLRGSLDVEVSVLINWKYDYEKESLYDLISEYNKNVPTVMNSRVDKHNQPMTVIKVFKNAVGLPPSESGYKSIVEKCFNELLKKQQKPVLKRQLAIKQKRKKIELPDRQSKKPDRVLTKSPKE